MPQGDKTKEIAFPLWLAGKPLNEIVGAVLAHSPTHKDWSVRGWVLDWERGRQKNWDPTIQ